MLLSTRIKLFVALWAMAESLVFVAVADVVGLGQALFLGVLTSLLGASLLRRTGATAMVHLRASLDGRRASAPEGLLDGTLTAAAAAALLLPGFLTDVLGLALSLSPVRTLVIRRVAGRAERPASGEDRRRSAPSAIDLEPGEWSRTATRHVGGGKLTPDA